MDTRELSEVGVSVCIPAYNAGCYIRATLASLIKQDHENVEFLIQDNCSSDNTVEIVKELQKKDSRIILYMNSSNIGYVQNINSLVKKAKYDIIAIFHADDIYRRSIISKQLKYIVDNGADAVFSRFIEINTKGKYLRRYPVFPVQTEKRNFYSGKMEEYLTTLLQKGNPFCCPSFMTKKETYLELGGFTEDFPSNEDMDLWIKYLKNGKRLTIVNEYLVLYRRTLKQGSMYWGELDKIGAFFEVMDRIVIPDYRINNNVLKNYKRRKAKEFLRVYSNCEIRGNKSSARLMLKESKEVYKFKISDNIWVVFQNIPSFYVIIRSIKMKVKRLVLSM